MNKKLSDFNLEKLKGYCYCYKFIDCYLNIIFYLKDMIM